MFLLYYLIDSNPIFSYDSTYWKKKKHQVIYYSGLRLRKKILYTQLLDKLNNYNIEKLDFQNKDHKVFFKTYDYFK